MPVNGWSVFFQLVHSVFEEAERKEHTNSKNVIESISEKVECCLVSVGRLRDIVSSASTVVSRGQTLDGKVRA